MEENVKIILDLIEDADFPAKRSISDYILLLLADLEIPRDKILEIEKIFDQGYKHYDNRGSNTKSL